MYQLYAYGTKYDNCEKIYLIYPFDELIIKKFMTTILNHKELKLDILFLMYIKRVCRQKYRALNSIFYNLAKLQLFKIIFKNGFETLQNYLYLHINL